MLAAAAFALIGVGFLWELVGALVGNDAGKDASVSEQLGTLDRVLFLVLDFLFVAARYANDHGAADVFWSSGATR